MGGSENQNKKKEDEQGDDHKEQKDQIRRMDIETVTYDKEQDKNLRTKSATASQECKVFYRYTIV